MPARDRTDAPREDASALVARVMSEIEKLEAAQGDDGATSVGGWYALTGNGYIEAQVNETDLRALCALVEQGEEKAEAYRATLADYDRRVGELQVLVEQGERDRRRLDTLEGLLEGADFAYGEEMDRHVALLRIPRGVRIGADIRAFADAAVQPNDSAARTGQEG